MQEYEKIRDCQLLLSKRIKNQIKDVTFNTFKDMCDFIKKENEYDRQVLEHEYYSLYKYNNETYV